MLIHSLEACEEERGLEEEGPPPPAEVGEESEKDLKNGEERQKKVEIAKASRMRKGERRRGRETEVGDTVRMTFRSFQLTKS